jgi:type VI secretion system protein ImpE
VNATELFKAGRLNDAVAAQIQEVRAHPTDQARRLFLFELLTFAGDLERARKQIDAMTYDDPAQQNALALLRRLLDSEEQRRKVFREGIAPDFFGAPPAHLRLRLEALGHVRLGRMPDAVALVNQANEALPVLHGRLNGKPFEGLRDCDDLLAGVLEVMANGCYFWVGLEQVASLTANPPQFPRDLIYVPARLEIGEATGEVFLPALYQGSHEHADDQVRLGRMTDWKESDESLVLGVGARDFLVGEEVVGLLEWRELVCDGQPAAITEE